VSAAGDARVDAMLPVAAALVSAVSRRSKTRVERILEDPTVDWPALAVVLADNVGQVAPELAALFAPQPARRRRPCVDCGTKVRGYLCNDCRDRRLGLAPMVLEDGDWVIQGGVKHWVPRQQGEVA
jgi:hypothetical protein